MKTNDENIEAVGCLGSGERVSRMGFITFMPIRLVLTAVTLGTIVYFLVGQLVPLFGLIHYPAFILACSAETPSWYFLLIEILDCIGHTCIIALVVCIFVYLKRQTVGFIKRVSIAVGFALLFLVVHYTIFRVLHHLLMMVQSHYRVAEYISAQ